MPRDALGYLAPETLQAVLDAKGVLAGKSTSVSIRSFIRWGGILVARSYEGEHPIGLIRYRPEADIHGAETPLVQPLQFALTADINLRRE